MSKSLGIDVGSASVRAVLVRSSYRRTIVEAAVEVERDDHASLDLALRAAAGALVSPDDVVAVSIEGDRVFARTLDIPHAASRQLAEVLPFELEAQLPIDLADLVYDYQIVDRGSSERPIRVLAAAARTDDVRERIALVRDALGVEPARVACGGFALGSLAGVVTELASGTVAVLDLDVARSELVVLVEGMPMHARTLSRGTAGLPGTAAALVREVRQTLVAWRATGGEPVGAVWLAGPGASAEGAEAYLAVELGLPVSALPAAKIECEPQAEGATLPRFGKALGLAIAATGRARVLDLRRGPLAYERGYGFLRERVPLLASLAAVIVLSFAFSTWAELRALGSDHATLEAALGTITREVLGEETSDPSRAVDLVDRAQAGSDEDPLPHADAFDVLVQLSQAVPESIAHDVEELDVQRGRVSIHGIVPTVQDAQLIAGALKSYRCFQDVKVVRTTQAVGEDRQKYAVELDLKCPTEGKKESKPPAASGSATAPEGSEKP